MSFLSKNLSYLAARAELNQTQVAKAAGVNQGTVSRLMDNQIKDTGYTAVWKLARYFRVSMDDLVGRDLEAEGPSPQSQHMEIDPDIFASALVSWDKALRHYKVPYDRIHKMAASLIFAYTFRSRFPGEMTKEQYETFDELVRKELRGDADVFGRVPAKDTRTRPKGTRKRSKTE